MSGFDFDALRDPLAPEPGPRERTRVEARARQLRARQLRNRLATITGAIVVVAALVLAVIGAQHNRGPELAVPGSSTTTITSPTSFGPSVDNRFIPPTTMQNGLVVLPVTLPDGETLTMKYPPAMHIADLGFAGAGGVIGFSGASSRSVTMSYTTIQHVYGDQKPIAVYHGANGEEVPLLRSIEPPGSRGTPPAVLVFQFGHWLVQVDDGQEAMTAQQLSTWASNLTGTVDADDYLVLHAQAPLHVANWFDGGFGPLNEHGPNQIELASHLYCGQPESDTSTRRRSTTAGQPLVTWCDGDLHVSAVGTPSFVNLAANALQVSPLSSATTTTTTSTTTTTQPAVTSSAPALSATWVSPTHGWVLEQSGKIIETTDGGSQRTRVGFIAVPADSNRRIRFADASRGFEFEPYPGPSNPLLTTDDGGAHWTPLPTPFSSVSDLAVSRGVVFVVGTLLSGGQFDGFRIWSAPISTLRWSMDPLPIAAGAGPVPSQQLTFAGGNGWMVNVDRDTESGARWSPATGHWTAWTPPCAGETGLAASTSTDVVAVCFPAFASSSQTSTVAFSHDGGTTFGPRTPFPAGFVGAPLSPSPDTAVVAAGGGLERTTDGGSSWHYVLHFDATGGVPDYGFTTSTQGFIILGSGEMLMTHDAGATWERARLP